MHAAVAVTSWFEPLSGTGSAVARVMHVEHVKGGGARAMQSSYNAFFYLCSALVGAAALVVVALAADEGQGKGGAAALLLCTRTDAAG